MTTTCKKGQLYQINLRELQSDPNQPRKGMDAQYLDELTASVVREEGRGIFNIHFTEPKLFDARMFNQ